MSIRTTGQQANPGRLFKLTLYTTSSSERFSGRPLLFEWRCGFGAVVVALWLWVALRLWRCGCGAVAVALWQCGAVAVALWRCGAVAVALWRCSERGPPVVL